jgi:hypothetical protein
MKFQQYLTLRHDSIWKSWNKIAASSLNFDLESPLLAEVIIRSIHFHDSRYLFVVCDSPNLNLTTIVIGSTKQVTQQGWKYYESSVNSDINFNFDGTWANVIEGESSLVDSIMKEVGKFLRLSFVGIGSASAIATLCGISVASGIDTFKQSHETVSVYSFGAPKLGDSLMTQRLNVLEENGAIKILSFCNDPDPVECAQVTSIWNCWNAKYFPMGHITSFSFNSCTEIIGYWECLSDWELGNVPICELPRSPQIDIKKSPRFKIWIPFILCLLIYIPILILMISQPVASPRGDEIKSYNSTKFQKLTANENFRENKVSKINLTI